MSAPVLSESFDETPNGAIPPDWTQFEAGTGAPGGQAWRVIAYTNDPADGKLAFNQFENVASGQAIDYLVTPQVSIGSGFRMTALLADLFAEDFGSTFEVRVSTAGNASEADFTDVLASYTEADFTALQAGPQQSFTFDLSAYAGMNVYVAFVHYNDDGDAFLIDDVVIEPVPTQPALAISATDIDFGTVPVGESATTTVTLSNSGVGTLTISSITSNGDDEFDIDDTGTVTSLGAGESTSFDVTFTPDDSGTSTGTVSVASNDAASPATITLSGTGTIVSTFTSTIGGSNSFNRPGTDGDGTSGSCSPTTASQVYATTPLSVEADGSYTIDADWDGFDGYLLLYADSFDPQDVCVNLIGRNDDGGSGSLIAGVALAATTEYVLVATTFGASNTAGGFTYSVSGPAAANIGAAGPALTASVGTIDFGEVPNGVAVTETVTITNTGGMTLNLGVPELTGDLSAISATVSSMTAFSIEPGESTSFTVTFRSTTSGTFTAIITIPSDDENSPATVTVTGQSGASPANDDSDSAIAITGPGTYTGTNRFATLEDGEAAASCSENAGSSVFFSYTPTADTGAYIDFGDSDFDTVVTIFAPDGTEIACDDDGGADRASLIVAPMLEGGVTYLIRVAGFGNAADGGPFEAGNISFDLREYDGSASVASRFSRSIDGPATFARPFSDGDGTAGSCLVTDPNLSNDVIDVTVSADGVYQITADWDGYDGYLLLYENAFDPAQPCLNLIARDDDFDNGNGPAGASQIEQAFLVSGTSYTLVATTFGAGAAGGYQINVVGTGGVNFPVANEAGALTVALGMIHPNPTAGAFRLSMTLAGPGAVRVAVYDVLGREVAVVHDGPLPAGETTLFAEGLDLPAGQYLVRAAGASLRETRTVTVVR